MAKIDENGLTKEELAVAERVKRAWLSRKKNLGSQAVAANLMGFHQTLFSAYINGKKPIGIGAALKFSKLLNIKAMELAPEILAPYASQVKELETEGIRYLPDEKDSIIADLKHRLNAVADVGAPHHFHDNRQDVESWNRILSAIAKLDSADLSYFADIIEHRLLVQDGLESNTGMRDLGKIEPDKRSSKSSKPLRPTRKPS